MKNPLLLLFSTVCAPTGFCVNSQRMSISKAPAETRGGDLLPIRKLLLLLLLEALRVSSSSLGFLYLRIACYVAFGTVGSRG